MVMLVHGGAQSQGIIKIFNIRMAAPACDKCVRRDRVNPRDASRLDRIPSRQPSVSREDDEILPRHSNHRTAIPLVWRKGVLNPPDPSFVRERGGRGHGRRDAV